MHDDDLPTHGCDHENDDHHHLAPVSRPSLDQHALNILCCLQWRCVIP